MQCLQGIALPLLTCFLSRESDSIIAPGRGASYRDNSMHMYLPRLRTYMYVTAYHSTCVLMQAAPQVPQGALDPNPASVVSASASCIGEVLFCCLLTLDHTPSVLSAFN